MKFRFKTRPFVVTVKRRQLPQTIHDSKTSLSSQQNEGQAVGKTRPQSSKIKSGFSQASKKLFKKLSNKTKSQEKSPQAELQQDATPGSSMIEPPINPPKSNNKENYESNSGVKNDDEELEEEFVTRHMLYKEAMYTSVHLLGTETERFPCDQEKMCIYVHEAFSTSPQEQQAVIDHVKNELFPMIGVNTKILKGEGFQSQFNKNPSPYCVIAIEQHGSIDKKDWKKSKSDEATKRLSSFAKQVQLLEERGAQFYENIPPTHKTILKPNEKNPVWNQSFQCVSLVPSTDVLTVEVWDRVEDNTLRKSFNNDATHKTAPKSIPVKPPTRVPKSDVFLGKVSKSVHEIPCEGFEKTMHLEKEIKNNDASHADLRIRIWLVHLYRHGKPYVDVVDKHTMLSCLWDWVLGFEIKRNGQDWDGQLPVEATCLLYQYALQTGIGEEAHSHIRSNAYAKHKTSSEEPLLKEKSMEVLDRGRASDIVDQVIEDSQLSIEDSILLMMNEEIFPIIRNHLRESEGRVSKALKAYKDGEDVLVTLSPNVVLPIFRGLMEKALRLCFLEWYQAAYTLRVQSTLNNADACQMIKSYVELITEVNNLLAIGVKRWHPEFWMLAQYDSYLTIMYDELQKMVNYDVEMVCWSLLQHYDDNRKLRQILKSARKQDECTVSALFSLYIATQAFVDVKSEIFPNDNPQHYQNLESYHKWFRPVLVLWLGFAVVRGSEMITRCVNIDKVSLENIHAKTSTSALDTATVIHQLVHFWEKLMWPDVCEKYVIIHFLMEVMCYFTVLYAERKLEKLELEGYFDTEDRFDISERLCIALNNIEYVKEVMEGVTEEVRYEELIQDLENACGITRATKNYRKRLKQVFTFSIGMVELVFRCIFKGVGLRVQPEIKRYVQETLQILQTLPNNTDKEVLLETLDPIFNYVDSNIVTLSQSLLTLNFARMLQLFWNTILQELLRNGAAIPYNDGKERGALFSKIILVVPMLRKYFATGDTGLNEDELNTPVYWEVTEALNQYTLLS